MKSLPSVIVEGLGGDLTPNLPVVPKRIDYTPHSLAVFFAHRNDL
jgi:hypothetical protein